MSQEDRTKERLLEEMSELRRRISECEASLKDCNERKEGLQESEERYRTMVQAVEDYAIFMLDPNGRIVTWNDGAKLIKGYGEDDVIGRHFSCFYPKEDIQQGRPEQVLKSAMEKGHFEEEGWRVRKDGTKFWANVVITALRDVDGNLRGFTKVTRDITKRRQLELQLQDALRAKEVLLREIHHRVRNNLQVMSSLLRLQSRYVGDEPTVRILNDTQSRIQSMAIVHDLLFESKDMERVNRREYVTRIARHLYDSLGVRPDRIKMSIKAQDAGCAIETAVPLGLIVNELVSNCLEHAFPENRSGEINVSIEPIGQDELELVVADNGVGMPIDLDPTSPGKFGLYLVNALAEQLHGSIELKKGAGLEVRIRFKEIQPERRRLP